MANIRIKDQTTDTALVAGDYVIVDNTTEGTRKFDLGQKLADIDDDFTDVRQDLSHLFSNSDSAVDAFGNVLFGDEELISIAWENGKITNGSDEPSTYNQHQRTIGYIPTSGMLVNATRTNSAVAIYLQEYDKDFQFIGEIYGSASLTSRNKNCAFIRLMAYSASVQQDTLHEYVDIKYINPRNFESMENAFPKVLTNSTLNYTTPSNDSYRFWINQTFKKGCQYKITYKINSIPLNSSNVLTYNFRTAGTYNNTGTIIDQISPGELSSYDSEEVVTYFVASNDAKYLYLWIKCGAGTINIDFKIELIYGDVNKLIDKNSTFKTIGVMRKVPVVSSSTQSHTVAFPYKMKAGNTYHFRVYCHASDIIFSSQAFTMSAFSAENLTGVANNYSYHNTFYRQRINEDAIYLNQWHYIDYTAEQDSEYITGFINDNASYLPSDCFVILQEIVEDDGFVFSNDTFRIKTQGRTVHDNKPLPFKRLGSVIGTGQSIVKTDDCLYAFMSTNSGTVLKIKNNNVIDSKQNAVLEHVINATPLGGEKFLISSFTNYGLSNEATVCVIYDYSTNTVDTTYSIPSIENKVLCFSEYVDSDTLLLAYRGDPLTVPNTGYFYLYDITNQTATPQGTYEYDRTYHQGGCAYGDIVYLMINNGWLDDMTQSKPKVIAINYKTGDIVNTIELDGFYECEGFYIDNDNVDGTYAYTLENSTGWIYCIKLT